MADVCRARCATWWPRSSGALAALLLVALLSASLPAQVRLLKRFDKNGDGKVTPSEVPESMRSIYRRIVERAGLDPDKPVRIEEASEKIEQKVVKKLAEEEGIQVSVTITGARPKLYIRWPGQQGPPSKVVGRGLPPIKPRIRRNGESGGTKLPAEYAEFDRDKDGQIGLYEWPRRRLAEFLKLDKNEDGFLTPRELGVRPKPNTAAATRSEETSREEQESQQQPASGAPASAPQPPQRPTPPSNASGPLSPASGPKRP